MASHIFLPYGSKLFCMTLPVNAEALVSKSSTSSPKVVSSNSTSTTKKNSKKHPLSRKAMKAMLEARKGPQILLHAPLSAKKVKTPTNIKTAKTSTSLAKAPVIPPPAMPPRIKKGTKKVTLFKPTVTLPKDPSDLELCVVRVFQEPLAPMHTPAVAGENAALAKALLAYRAKTNPEDVSDLTGFISAFPKSRWRPAVELNLGTRRFETLRLDI